MVIGAPLLAVVIAVKAGEPVRLARTVTLVATGCYVAALLLGLLVLAAAYVDNLGRALRPTAEEPATASDVR